MNHTEKLLTIEKIRRLSDRLSSLESVTRFDRPGEREADTIVHALMDLEESFREFLDKLLPRLLNESLTSEQLNDTLHEVGEELRHILYHIKDPRFFRYLFEV